MRALWFSAPVLLGSFAVLASKSTMPYFDRIVFISFSLLLVTVIAILRFA